MIKECDKIRLKTGLLASVSEVLGNGTAFIIEYFTDNGEFTTDQVTRDDIVSVFVETEQPLATAGF